MGYIVNSGAAQPHLTVTKWCEQKKEFERHIARFRKYCGKLKHWKLTNLDYRELPNIKAVWFIDPPYYGVNVSGKHRYTKNKIDYQELAEWCKSRNGQVIVCENSEANWLPFVPLKEMYGQKHKTTEVIWTNRNFSY